MSEALHSQITFRYFLEPHKFSSYSDEPETCEICSLVRPGYGGGFYGIEELEIVCEQCLALGRLAEKEQSANEGDPDTLREQLRNLEPHMSGTQIEELVQKRTNEVEICTPQVLTWQHFFWPVHCGDYCCYIREAGKSDLNNLAPDGNGQTFLGKYLQDPLDDDDIRHLWTAMRPASPDRHDETVASSLGVYLFQCLHCDEYVILHDWD